MPISLFDVLHFVEGSWNLAALTRKNNEIPPLLIAKIKTFYSYYYNLKNESIKYEAYYG